MKTKQDLLDRMAALTACYEATTWVTWVTAQEGSALEIGLRSNRSDWIVWLIGRIDPLAIADFARRCADRAKGYAADRAANANANAAAYTADRAAYADRAADRATNADRADRAANAAANAAAYAYADERQAQFTDLRAVWVGFCT